MQAAPTAPQSGAAHLCGSTQCLIGRWRRAGRLMSPVNQLRTQLQQQMAALQQQQKMAEQQMAQSHLLQQQQVAGNQQQASPLP